MDLDKLGRDRLKFIFLTCRLEFFWYNPVINILSKKVALITINPKSATRSKLFTLFYP